MLLEFRRDNLPVYFGKVIHPHAGEEFHGQTHGAVVLETRRHGGQRYVGMLAKVLLYGGVGAVPLGHGRGGLPQEAIAEVGPIVPPEGPLEEQLVEVADFPVGKDVPDARLLVVVEEGGGGSGPCGERSLSGLSTTWCDYLPLVVAARSRVSVGARVMKGTS